MKEGMRMLIVRGSEYQRFLRCRTAWKWEWIDGLKAKKPDGKLFIGTLIHKWMEVYYKTGHKGLADRAMEELYESTNTELMDQIELQELWKLACDVTDNYFEMWAGKDGKWEVLATELQFLVKLDDDIAFTGTIDLVFKDENGHIWFMDHKTTASIDKYEKNSIMDRQISRYWWALQQIAAGVGRVKMADGTWGQYDRLLGLEVHGFIYNVILKDTPKPPEPLKKGGLSKNKAQKTTYKLYEDAIFKLYNNEVTTEIMDEYEDILTHLKNQENEYGNRYFKRVPVFRNQSEVDASIWEFFHTTQEMAMVQGFVTGEIQATFNPIYRNITGDCSWDCQFKALCMAQIAGEDHQVIEDVLYEKAEQLEVMDNAE